MSYSKYINTFPNAEAYETYKASSDFKRPNVAWIQDENRVVYEGGQEELPDSGGGSDEKFEKLKEFINITYGKKTSEWNDYFGQDNFKFPEGLEHTVDVNEYNINRLIINPAQDCFENFRYLKSNVNYNLYSVETISFRNLKEIKDYAINRMTSINRINFYDCKDDCIVNEQAFEEADTITDLYFYNCDTNFAHIVQDCIVRYGIDTTWYSEPGAIIHIVVNR